MLTFEGFKETATTLVAQLKEKKTDTRTELLCYLLESILTDSENFKFSFPKLKKEKLFELGLDKNGFKKEKCDCKSKKIFKQLFAYTEFSIAILNDCTAMEESTLFLFEKTLVLYKENMLSVSTSKALFESINELIPQDIVLN